jgi:hypothetical protein
MLPPRPQSATTFTLLRRPTTKQALRSPTACGHLPQTPCLTMGSTQGASIPSPHRFSLPITPYKQGSMTLSGKLQEHRKLASQITIMTDNDRQANSAEHQQSLFPPGYPPPCDDPHKPTQWSLQPRPPICGYEGGNATTPGQEHVPGCRQLGEEAMG